MPSAETGKRSRIHIFAKRKVKEESMERLITIAIHTYHHAMDLKSRLERVGIDAVLQNVNLENPAVSPGIRVRIKESDLPRALRLIENPEIFAAENAKKGSEQSRPLVLLPIDFSAYSARACEPAFALAAKHGAKVLILHVYTPASVAQVQPLSASPDFTDEAGMLAEDELIDSIAEKQMKEFTTRLRNRILAGDVEAAPFETRIAGGLPEEAIAEVVRRQRPMLIVMGTRGMADRSVKMLGSVTAEVLDTVRCPLLAVPANTPIVPLSQVSKVLYFAVPDQQDIVAIDTLRRMYPAETLDVTLAMLPPRRQRNTAGVEAALNSLAEYCRDNYPDCTFETMVVTHDNGRELMSVLDSVDKINLVCVASKHRNALSRLFNPTLAHRLLFHVQVPMLVIPV